MTLIVNHEGIVYQKNLGKVTAAIASKMTRFDLDSELVEDAAVGDRTRAMGRIGGRQGPAASRSA
jgi:hypothetical protein